jgi:hypothetical protein
MPSSTRPECQWRRADSSRLFYCRLVVAIPLLLIRTTGRVALARDFLILGVFSLLIALTYLLDGMSAPTVFWLAVCPSIATAAVGRRPGMVWSLIGPAWQRRARRISCSSRLLPAPTSGRHAS